MTRAFAVAAVISNCGLLWCSRFNQCYVKCLLDFFVVPLILF